MCGVVRDFEGVVGKLQHTWKDNIKIDVRQVRCEGVTGLKQLK
jgi:hypothetical protein